MVSRLRLFAITTLFTGGFALSATGCRQIHPAETTAETPPAAIAIVRPVYQALTIPVEQPGQVQAIERTPIFARIPGFVAEVCVDMNHRVRKGQLLARLDVPEVEAEYRRKTALVLQAKAEVEQAQRAQKAAEANVATTQARIREAEAARTRARANLERWRVEHQRIANLVGKGMMDKETRDEALNESKSAESARDETEAKVASALAVYEESAAQLAKARADVAVAEARREVALADEHLAKSMLDYRDIKSPFDGLVVQRHVHTGHLLKAGLGDSCEPLFVLVRTDRVRIFVEVPEAESVYVRPGSRAFLRTQTARGRSLEATVARVSWILQPANRTLVAEIERDADDLVRPGMYAYAILEAKHPPVWTLPLTAVAFKNENAYGYRMENDRAVRTPLRIGARNADFVEILGLKLAPMDASAEGPETTPTGAEMFVATNPAALRDGQEIRINP